jgi:hypothetical protein
LKKQSIELDRKVLSQIANDNPAALTDPILNERGIDSWLTNAYKVALDQQGAVLLQTGRLVEREQLFVTVRQSLFTLLNQLRAAQVVSVQMEQKQNTLCFAGELTGYIDMTVTKQNGDEAVLDIKWGGASYRKASLKANNHLQLLTYSYLRHRNQSAQRWPALAYFIIGTSELLAQNRDFFPNAQVVKPVTLENAAQCWDRMRQTWLWRRKQLDQGLIEITVTGTTADENSKPGNDALPIAETNDSFNDYGVLTGWSDQA